MTPLFFLALLAPASAQEAEAPEEEPAAEADEPTDDDPPEEPGKEPAEDTGEPPPEVDDTTPPGEAQPPEVVPESPEPPAAEPPAPEATPVDDWGESNDEDGWGDDTDEAGFADTTTETDEAADRPWTFSGYLRSQEALWVQRLTTEPVALVRQTAELTVDLSWNEIRARATVHGEVDPKWLLTDQYDDVARTYGWRLEPRELWVGTSYGPVELTAGRQVVAWGEGLVLSPTDVVNARDNRDPGMTDIADLRRPVTMLRVQAFLNTHRFEVMYVPEADFGLRSSPEGPYGLMPGLAANAESPDFVDAEELLAKIDTSWEDVQPRWALNQWQVFGRWTWRGPGFDLALYGASLLDKQGVLSTPEDPYLLDVTELAIPLDHQRYTFAGFSAPAVVRSFAFRTVVAAEWGRRYIAGDLILATNDGPMVTAARTERAVYTAMLGLTWTGVKNLRVDAEASRGYLPRGRTNLTMPVGETQYALRVSYLMLDERLSLDALAAGLGTRLEYGFVASLAATYEVKDGFHATLGYVTYQPSDLVGPLIGMDTHDRLFAQVKYSF